MRTSLIETEQIEAYLLQLSDPGDSLVFEVKLLLQSELQDRVQWQKETYQIVRRYSRDQLKKEIEAVHQQLFTQEKYRSFSQKIRQLFSKR